MSGFVNRKVDSINVNSAEQNIKCFNSLFKGKLSCDDPCKLTLINCYFGSGVVVKLGGDCLFSNFFIDNNISIKSANRIIWQCWPHNLNCFVILCHGFDDNMALDRRSEQFTIFNHSWLEISSCVNLTPEDLWNPDTSCQTLSSAKLFAPSFTLHDQVTALGILMGLDPSEDTTIKKEVIINRWKCARRLSLQDIFVESNINDISTDKIFMEVLKNMIKETENQIMGPSLLPCFKYINASKWL